MVVYGGKYSDHYFDLDVVRSEPKDDRARGDEPTNWPGQPERPRRTTRNPNPAGAPPLNWWVIPTAQYPDAHYAVMPGELLRLPMLAGVPERVRTACGKPSERIVDSRYALPTNGGPTERDRQGRGRKKDSGRLSHVDDPPEEGWERIHETLGWTNCGCPGGDDRWRSGVVLDPFAGTGTTLAVAFGHSRSAIGIDLDERNVELARQRVGPMWFFESEDHPEVPA